jgi:hypothetical protein
MSWWDDLVDLGSSALDWFTGNSVGANLARTAVTGFALNQVTRAINKDEQKNQTPDKGVRVQVNPDPNAKIPVIYGTTALSGIVTDAVMSDQKTQMFYCITLCEKTGKLNLGLGADSEISVTGIWRDNQQLSFDANGVVNGSVDDADNFNTDISGLIRFWVYTNGSLVSQNTDSPAWDIFPGWTSSKLMSNLVFVIVRVDYNREKNVTGLGDLTFKVKNTMTLPGDCLYDYMTNTRYGAGIPRSEISV